MKKRVALYVRVSTAEQKKHGISIDDQLSSMREYCDQKGYIISDIYNDAGISASKSYKKRPELLRMFKDCQDDKIDLVLFTRLDRFFRNVSDYHECMKLMNGVPWATIRDEYDASSASGRFKINIMLSVAENEAQIDSERIRDSYSFKRQRGDYIGGAPPTGYRPDGNHHIEKDPNTKEAIEAIFKTYLDTFSIKKTQDVASQYGLSMARSSLQRTLKRSCYYGVANNCSCEPYITKEQHDKIVSVMQNRVRETKTNKTYIFSGVFRCAKCGHSMVSTYTTTKYYRCGSRQSSSCKCTGCNITEAKAEKYLLDQLDDIIGRYNLSVDQQMNELDTNNALKKKASLEAKLKRVGERYEDGDISREEYVKKRDTIKYEISQIKIVPIQKMPTMECKWKDIYLSFTDEEKNAFWKELFPNRINVDKIGTGWHGQVFMDI